MKLRRPWNSTPLTPQKPLGRYGRMRKAYLKAHRKMTFNSLLLTGELTTHLAEIDPVADELLGRDGQRDGLPAVELRPAPGLDHPETFELDQRRLTQAGLLEHLPSGHQARAAGARSLFRFGSRLLLGRGEHDLALKTSGQ